MTIINSEPAKGSQLVILNPGTASQYETISTVFLLPSQGQISTLTAVKQWVLATPLLKKHCIYIL